MTDAQRRRISYARAMADLRAQHGPPTAPVPITIAVNCDPPAPMPAAEAHTLGEWTFDECGCLTRSKSWPR
jgi:hypothetical protein